MSQTLPKAAVCSHSPEMSPLTAASICVWGREGKGYLEPQTAAPHLPARVHASFLSSLECVLRNTLRAACAASLLRRSSGPAGSRGGKRLCAQTGRDPGFRSPSCGSPGPSFPACSTSFPEPLPLPRGLGMKGKGWWPQPVSLWLVKETWSRAQTHQQLWEKETPQGCWEGGRWAWT